MGQACLASVVATAASRQPAKQLAHNVNILQLPPFVGPRFWGIIAPGTLASSRLALAPVQTCVLEGC